MAGSDSLYIVKDRLQGLAVVPPHNGPGVECDSLSTWRKEGRSRRRIYSNTNLRHIKTVFSQSAFLAVI